MRSFQKDRSLSKWKSAGYSLTELVVVAGLAAAIFTTGAMAFRTVAMHQKRATSYLDVNLGAAINKGFYNETGASITAYSAPNYGMCGRAEVMRNMFWDDAAHASAIYCVPRINVSVNEDSLITDTVAGLNYFHPPLVYNTETPPQLQAPDVMFYPPGMLLDHSNRFMEILPGYGGANFPFRPFRGVPATTDVNASIFVMQASGAFDGMGIRAIYDIDFLRISSPTGGVYASVKRYVGASFTDYYDCFYADDPSEQQSVTDFGPVFACFEKTTRLATTETGSAQAFKKAGARPFYFIWWPDPAQPRLKSPAATTYADTDPRHYYRQHEAQTEYMFTVPMFPQL